MLARAFGLLTVAFLAASLSCSSSSPGPVGPGRAGGPNALSAPSAPKVDLERAGVRYFQGLPEDAFWVSHGAERDEVVVSGARLVLSPRGEILEAAWEADLWATAEVVQGSLAVAPHLGGGYVHWTRSGVYRSRAFTGPLEHVPLGIEGAAVRGARSGLGSVAIFTEVGPRELWPGEARARPWPEPALQDIAAIDGARAARLDLFGRAQVTRDGGKVWIDVAAEAGLSGRALAPAPDEIGIETGLGRLSFGRGGLGPLEAEQRSSFRAGRPFQRRLPGALVELREDQPWVWRDTTPLGAAALSGVRLPDGAALAVSMSGAARVDLRTGAATELDQGWIPDGLSCAPHRAPDAILLLCAWEEYQGYGGYVLRTERGEPPVIEKELSDDGFYVADDRGAVGFVGSCSDRPRAAEPEARSNAWGEIVPGPKVCVRRGRGDWVERAVDLGGLGDRRSLLAWVPRLDGSAVALVRGGTGLLPQPASIPRAREEGGVRVLQLGQAAPGWFWTRPPRGSYGGVRGAPMVLVDRRFQAREDGSVAAWLSSAESGDSYEAVSAGATVAEDGSVVVHPLPSDAAAMVVTGSRGLVATASGELHETLDHGRTFVAQGMSPVPPSALQGGCSEIGCMLAGVVRVGWGSGGMRPAIAPDPQAACRRRGRALSGFGPSEAVCREESRRLEARDAAEPAPLLSCAPVGQPATRAAAGGVEAGSSKGGQLTVELGYGDEITVVREADAPEPPPAEPGAAAGAQGGTPAGGGSGGSAENAGKAGTAGRKPRGAPALRTHSLFFRPPFDPAAPIVRLNATDAGVVTRNPNTYRRPTAIPLLGAGGEVAVLLLGEAGEAVVGAKEIAPLPVFEPRRYYVDQGLTASGVLLAPGRAAILGENRRRTHLEEHGPDPQRPPRAVGLDRELTRKRPLVLARRDDGALGMLVLDGTAPATAGVAALDPRAGTPGPVEALAGWSTLTAGGDPRCRALRGGWSALLVLDPSAAVRLDAAALPGVTLGNRGLALVRWGKERVCLDALDAAVVDPRRRGSTAPAARMVARFAGAGRAGAALVSADLTQGLACAVAPPGGAAGAAGAKGAEGAAGAKGAEGAEGAAP